MLRLVRYGKIKLKALIRINGKRSYILKYGFILRLTVRDAVGNWGKGGVRESVRWEAQMSSY